MTIYVNPGPIQNMPPTPNKVESTWGNAIRDRTVQHFATTADRTTAIPSPVEGQCVYVDADHALEVYAGATDGWCAPWNLAWGRVASVAVGTSQGSITTVVDITSATVTWTAVTNRRYKVTVACIFQNTGANGNNIYVADGSNVIIRQGGITAIAAASNQTYSYSYEETGISAGSVTRKLRGLAAAGTLTIEGTVGTTQLLVEDMGPNGNPS